MPISIPDMDEDAEYIPIRIYPAITPIFNGVYVRFRLSLRITRTDFAYGETCGLFFFILFMDVTLPDSITTIDIMSTLFSGARACGIMMMWIGNIYIFFYDKNKLRRCTPINNFGDSADSSLSLLEGLDLYVIR
jgi:hypothetical protein